MSKITGLVPICDTIQEDYASLIFETTSHIVNIIFMEFVIEEI